MGLYTIQIEAKDNSKPTSIGNNTIQVNHNSTYVFTEANFTTETSPPYSDPDGDGIKNIQIIQLLSPGTGDLLLNGVAITLNQEISMSAITSGFFTYVSDSGTTTSYQDLFKFDASDVGSEIYSGLEGIITMSVASYQNQPPTTGDNSDTIAHAATKVFTAADFTTGTTPAYNDPEGDAALNLRVNTLPANGTLRLSGVAVVANQVIPFTSISASAFTYTATKNNITLRDVSFDFDIEDAGSGQFSS